MDRAARARLSDALGRLAEGDRSAMSEVYRGLRPPVLALAQRMVGVSDAEDIAEEVMLEIFSRASDFDRERDALAWAVTITAWKCRTERRRRSRRAALPLEQVPAEPESQAPDPESALVEREARAALELATAELSELDREALEAVLSGQTLSAALRKRKERLILRLRRLFLGGDLS